MSRHLVAVPEPAGEAYRVRGAGESAGAGEALLRRRGEGGPWLVSYGHPAGGQAYARDAELPAALDTAAAGAVVAELLAAYAAGVAAAAYAACPAPGMHGPQCAESRHNERGDCDGQVRVYVAQTYVEGATPGEPLTMCTSHGRQAARRHEVRAA